MNELESIPRKAVPHLNRRIRRNLVPLFREIDGIFIYLGDIYYHMTSTLEEPVIS